MKKKTLLIFSIMLSAFVITRFFTPVLFVNNSPQLHPNLALNRIIDKLKIQSPGDFLASLIKPKEKTVKQLYEIAKTMPEVKLGKGVYAKGDNNYRIIRLNTKEIDMAEMIVTNNKGETVTIRYPRDQKLSQEFINLLLNNAVQVE